MLSLTIIFGLFLLSGIGGLWLKTFSWVKTGYRYLFFALALNYLWLCATAHPVIDLRWQLLSTAHFNFLIHLTFDSLSQLMLGVLIFLSIIIHEYAYRYLQFDREQQRFISLLLLITTAIFIFVTSANLFTAFLGWQLSGLCLYGLLNHYHFDSQANRAAKKKFIVNRLGEVAFLTGVVLAFYHYGTTEFALLASSPETLRLDPIAPIVLGLVMLGVMTKSAQFPFHVWLPDTLATPTPVSALMHAGIINAGGVLLARLSHALIHTPTLMQGIFLIGLVSTLLGSANALLQGDIKKNLAYSTISQMGYMIMQVGMGFFIPAILHLITHGFYKATLFLQANGQIQTPIHTPIVKIPTIGKRIVIFMISSIVALAALWGYALYFPNLNLFSSSHLPLTTLLFWLLTYALLTTLSNHTPLSSIPMLLLFFLMGSAYFYSYEQLIDFLPQITKTPMVYPWQRHLLFALTGAASVAWIFQAYLPTREVCWRHLHRLSIERIYRRYLLAPMRNTGDRLITILQVEYPLRGTLLCILIFFLLSVTIDAIRFWHHVPNHVSIVGLFLGLYAILLLAANRAPSLIKVILLLLLAQCAYVNIGLFSPHQLTHQFAIFHAVNVGGILLALLWLSLQYYDPMDHRSLQENRLPTTSIYLCVFIFLLLGIPGTPTFFSEFFFIRDFMINPLPLPMLLFFLSTFVLLAIVMMHTLQDYVFNPDTLLTIRHHLSYKEHLFFLSIIACSFYNSFFPHTLLRILA